MTQTSWFECQNVGLSVLKQGKSQINRCVLALLPVSRLEKLQWMKDHPKTGGAISRNTVLLTWNWRQRYSLDKCLWFSSQPIGPCGGDRQNVLPPHAARMSPDIVGGS